MNDLHLAAALSVLALTVCGPAQAMLDDSRAEERPAASEMRRHVASSHAALPYDSEGRRDPFRSPLGAITEGCVGTACIPHEALQLTGILRLRDGDAALFESRGSGGPQLVTPGVIFSNAMVASVDYDLQVVTLHVPEPKTVRGFKVVHLTLGEGS